MTATVATPTPLRATLGPQLWEIARAAVASARVYRSVGDVAGATRCVQEARRTSRLARKFDRQERI